MVPLTRAGVLFIPLLLLALPATAQQSPLSPTGPAASDTLQAPRPDTARSGQATLSSAEEQVKNIISEPGVHVVRLWAPWCPNSTGEMGNGWGRIVEAPENEHVTFTFVTVWNNSEGGADMIEKYGIPLERITEVVPKSPEQGRLDRFMGYALNWVPSTWIFRTPGAAAQPERAFALNYGEMQMSTLQRLINAAQADW